MSKQPLGKTLLRNVIRHTDAHNKIQEEMEMWKMRGWEIQMSDHKHLSDTESSRRMYCDQMPDQSRDLSQSRVSEHDDREARYWTRKLYEFESNDPDRWGHSGFKELYPEEFESDSEKDNATEKIRRHKTKKSANEAGLKQSKKSSRKKKKRKKKSGGEKHKKCLSSSDDNSATKEKQRRKKGKRHKNNKYAKISRRDDESSSEDSSDAEQEKERRTRKHKKQKQDSQRDSDSGLNVEKKRRRNWKAAGEESSHDSSGD